MRTCSNVSALARELGIRRKWLYAWRDEATRTKSAQNGEAVVAGGQETAQERVVSTLNQRIATLQQLAGRQAAEIDFFRGALRRIKEQRQRSGETGGTASTTKSGS